MVQQMRACFGEGGLSYALPYKGRVACKEKNIFLAPNCALVEHFWRIIILVEWGWGFLPPNRFVYKNTEHALHININNSPYIFVLQILQLIKLICLFL